MKSIVFKRIMLFEKPGSGKSTFATWLSKFLEFPLYHFDKHLYVNNWVERDYNELHIQKMMLN